MTGEAQDGGWPMPKFYFRVRFGSQENIASFQEVSGLDVEEQPIEYRHGNSPIFTTLNMPGNTKTGNVTLKKGIFVNDTNFWNWYDTLRVNIIHRENVVIELLDESGNPTMSWTLNNAWPTKITGVDLQSNKTEVTVETLELTHEGLTIKNGL